jgi:membrane-bound hydrogenase subunit beta
MSKEEIIISDLVQKFPFLEGKCTLIRPRRITIDVDRSNTVDFMDYAKASHKFDLLCTITGLDVGENLQFIYHIANYDGIMINVKTNAPKTDPAIKTLLNVYNGATFYERELEDLLGAKVEGLPEGRHYPLPENWPKGQYPLRKDWKTENSNQTKEVEE